MANEPKLNDIIKIHNKLQMLNTPEEQVEYLNSLSPNANITKRTLGKVLENIAFNAKDNHFEVLEYVFEIRPHPAGRPRHRIMPTAQGVVGIVQNQVYSGNLTFKGLCSLFRTMTHPDPRDVQFKKELDTIFNAKYKGTDHALKDVIEGMIVADLKYYKAPPKSFSPSEKFLVDIGFLRPIGKPDVDNLYKAFIDNFEDVLYKNDSQVVVNTNEKYYTKGDEPERIELKIRFQKKAAILPPKKKEKKAE